MMVWRGGGRGQSLVEFALTLPIAMALLMGVIDLGFVLHAHVQVAGACYEGARRGSLFPGNLNDLYTQNDSARLDVVKASVQGAMGLLDISNPQNFDVSSDVKITYYPTVPTDSSTRTGDEMVVTVSYRQPVWFNLLSGLSNSRLQVTSSTRVRIQ